MVRNKRSTIKQSRAVRPNRNRCMFCKKDSVIDYKDLDVLRRFVSGKGKITSRRINRNCAKHQRQVSNAIKRGRYLALLPYTAR